MDYWHCRFGGTTVGCDSETEVGPAKNIYFY